MLIGLKGYKNVGKDTVADFLVHRHGFEKHAFAAKMKEAVSGLFGIHPQDVDRFKDNHGGTLDFVEVHVEIGASTEYVYGWREFLQRFGTQMGRNTFGEDFWVDQLFAQLSNKLDDTDIVISDCRFSNEAERIREYGGYIIEIVRPGYEPDGHESEEPLPRELIDAIIRNDDDIQSLYATTEAVFNGLR